LNTVPETVAAAFWFPKSLPVTLARAATETEYEPPEGAVACHPVGVISRIV